MLFERQQYQEDCVGNIITVLKDTHRQRAFSVEALRRLHQDQAIPKKDIKAEDRRLDVLMETGTGKTFTYLKTMYELNKQYGINKFIVFVPRIAIRAVVVQNIDLTADYFFQEYGKRIKKHIYGGASGLSQVFDYIRNEGELSVLILTGASITSKNAADRILTSQSEKLFDAKTPLDSIAGLNPVVFIDEPHLLKGAGFIEKYNQYFSNTLRIRFGATFPTDGEPLSNVVYALDSHTSFCDYHVKKIRVSTAVDGDSDIKFYQAEGRNLVGLSYFQEGIEHRHILRYGESIAAITGNPAHANLSVLKVKGKEVFLSHGSIRRLSDNDYTLTDDSIRKMIKKAIEIHFEKEEELFKRGIKSLSLFFIPNVADFRGDNPRVKNIFDEEYEEQRKGMLNKELSPAYRAYLQKDYDSDRQLCVREGYFSGDRGSKDERESYGVNLILNDKSKLLSTDEPLRFIFSVWALQEGWDNPNVMTICKLAATDKETSRRQQVGRGLRLAVNDEGKRQTFKHCGDNEDGFYEINMLDVVVSGHEENFIEEIQKEIIGDSLTYNRLTTEALKKVGLNDSQISHLTVFLEVQGIIRARADEGWEILAPVADFLEDNRGELHPSLAGMCDALIKAFRKAAASPVENRDKKTEKIGIRAERFKEFQELWKTITGKAKIIYRHLDDAELIKTVKSEFDKETLPPVRERFIKKTYDHRNNSIDIEESDLGEVQFFRTDNYTQFITDFADEEKLPLHFCCEMFNALDKDKIKKNPRRAVELLTTILKEAIHRSIVQNIDYEFNGEIAVNARSIFYEDDACTRPKKEIEAHKIGRYIDEDTAPGGHYLYDKIVYDSGIEKTVVNGDPRQINDDKIVVFAKLPKISIPTPYKSYSPDFAYFIQRQGGKKLFLVVETKGYNREADIPPDEQRKIEYAGKFFAALNEATETANVVFKTRINRAELATLLTNIGESKP